MLVHIISIPKSGTYFLSSVIKEACRLSKKSYSDRFSGHPIILCDRDMLLLRGEVSEVEAIDADIFGLMGHWPHHYEIYDIFNRYPKVFIYRHPLDVAVSFIEGAIRGLHADVVTQSLTSLDSKEKMYLDLLYGVENVKHPWANGLRYIIESRIGWMGESNVCSIKFCELRRAHVKKLAEALGIIEVTFRTAVKNVVHKHKEKTFRQGIMYAWKEEMPKDIQKEYITHVGDLISKLGFDI